MSSNQIDPRVQDTIDTFTALIRRDLDAHVQVLVADLARVLQDSQAGWRAELDRAVSAARLDAESACESRLKGLRAEWGRDMDARLSQERSELEAGMAAEKSGLRERQAATLARLLGVIGRLDEGTSLSGILETLAKGAAVEAARVAILVVDVDEDMLRSWGHFGFASDEAPHDMPVGESALLSSAVAEKQSLFVSASVENSSPATPAFLRVQAGHVGLVVPLIVGGEVVALLYADGVDRHPDEEDACIWVDEVELLVRHAALRLENVTSVRTVAVLTKPA